MCHIRVDATTFDKAIRVPLPSTSSKGPLGTWLAVDILGGPVRAVPAGAILSSWAWLAPELALWAGLSHLVYGPIFEH